MDAYLITDKAVERRPVRELSALLARDDGLVWVDIPECDPDAVEVLTNVLHLHPLAVRDLVKRNRVPKLHAYPDHILVVLHSPARGARGHVHYVELNQVIGANYLITVHGPLSPSVDPDVAMRETQAVLSRLREGRLRPRTGLGLSHAIVSALIRSQEEFIEMVTTDVWRLDQRATDGNVDDPEAFLDELFRARHGLLAVRTMASLGGDVYERMGELPGISDEDRPLVTDLAEELHRVGKAADSEREYLQGVIEFYQTTLTVKSSLAMQVQNERIERLTEASYAQSEGVKKISAWAAIFFAPTLIGTIYGMNFRHMPELGWTVGYPLAIIAMVLACVALYLVFKRQRWL